MIKEVKKQQLKQAASKIADQGFSDFLHDHNLVHLLPFSRFRRHKETIGSLGDAQSLASLLVELGPGFVEAGKIVASRSDIIPIQYQTALLNNESHASELSQKKVKSILRVELGRNIEKEITHIDAEQYRANLVSQTHKAILEDGRRVLITINNPKAIMSLSQSVSTIEWLYNWYAPQVSDHEIGLWESIFNEFEQRALMLTDLTQVAGRAEILQSHYEDKAKISIPEVLWEYTSQNVLTQIWQNHPNMKETTQRGVKPGIAKKYVSRYVLEAMVHQYGVSGVFILRPNIRDIQIAEKNTVIMNHLLGTGILEPDERKQFIAMLYALLNQEPELAAKVLLHNHYNNIQREHRYFGAGISVPKSKKAPVSDLIWELLEYGWHGNLDIPLGFSQAAESILYLEHALAQFDDVDINDNFSSAIAKYIPEIFAVDKSADIYDIVRQVTTV
ncbi:hypothetical protein CL632_03295 [bacterium]|mgnify:FL=1|jgi:predicted unusual protein kinase regulating ubiquinone biosynthesis (AarF/ABC1/UbiB family)|nr:hypothetical protein [bacterium]MDP6571605.1 AarF/UbiB family protein [Patescibacteria group bacterium]|tara:strand:+ start:16309 stop:17646 length:1338 start_codon:yes stop_codon:yes gene_type:complete